MRERIMRVTLALCMLVTALQLMAPQYVGADETMPFDLEKAIREAKTPAEHQVIASYCDRAAATEQAQAAESRKRAEAYRNLAGKGQFRIESRYRQMVRRYENLAVDHAACSETHRQIAQTVVQKPQ
jgi:hypothetical protein